MRNATVVLPVPGLPVKHMCRVGAPARQPHALAQAIHEQERGDLADARLHRDEPDQLAVELVEEFLDVGGLELGLEIQARLRLRGIRLVRHQ